LKTLLTRDFRRSSRFSIINCVFHARWWQALHCQKRIFPTFSWCRQHRPAAQ
jgi:hypothetical protein